MRIANLAGRLVILTEAGCLDVERLSEGAFSSDPQAVFDRWTEFVRWADGQSGEIGEPFDYGDLLAPVPRPRQIFAIGLNYRAHAAESGFDIPEYPVVFTKFQSAITSATATVDLPSDSVDWEIELVCVIGREANRVGREDAWDHVAGLTVGQDLSERVVQRRGPAPQFSLGKSFPGFAPIGPVLVTPDEFPDRDDLRLRSELVAADGSTAVLQDGATSDLIFSVAELVASLSTVVTLLPGDLIFTGTPSGVGMGMQPPQFLKPGQTLVSSIDGIGTLRNALR